MIYDDISKKRNLAQVQLRSADLYNWNLYS